MVPGPDSFQTDPMGRFALLVALLVFLFLLVVEPQLLDQWGDTLLVAIQAHLPSR